MSNPQSPKPPRERKRRTYGTGRHYLQPGSSIYWIQYYVPGESKPHRESTGTRNEKEAKRILATKVGNALQGKLNPLQAQQITITDLCKLALADQRTHQISELKGNESRLQNHINRLLGQCKAVDFGNSQYQAYVDIRRDEDASNGTINKELALINRGYTIAVRETTPPLLSRQPKIKKLDESGNVRPGFLTPPEYTTLLDALPQRLRALYVCGYHCGVRLGQWQLLKPDQIDFQSGEIRWDATQTKNGKPHTVPIYGDMEPWLRRQLMYVSQFKGTQRRKGRVFPVGDHLKGWKEACERAGVPGLIFHDLRRSAVRNLINAGVPRERAMRITGHLTESVFVRYNIEVAGDMQRDAQTMAEYLKANGATAPVAGRFGAVQTIEHNLSIVKKKAACK